jgi:hypothetical protein
MTERISLTAAEIAFLLTAGGPNVASPAAELLGLTDADRTDVVLAAGLGSLLLRHLATPVDDQQVELGSSLIFVAQGLAYPQVCVQVGLVADDFADGAVLFESGTTRYLLAPRSYRC